MQRKFWGSLYTSSSLTTLPLIVVDSCFLAPQIHESFCPTNLQFLSLSNSGDTTLDISMKILVSPKKPFFGLLGPNPSSTLISQTNPYTIGPFGNIL